jgi:hypothetical protein
MNFTTAFTIADFAKYKKEEDKLNCIKCYLEIYILIQNISKQEAYSGDLWHNRKQKMDNETSLLSGKNILRAT